ncbi:MAG: T9SS type A sorting domain-containing protein [Ignavibacteria bacterium]|nr:T9SS type A sorting domain-containing protein [Ignavibacteria bacterium]
MKIKILFFVLIAGVMFFAFTINVDKTDNMMLNNVVIRFEATNGNGNNLWLDNFSIGQRYNNDLAVSSMSLKDKNYLLPGVTSANLSPVVTIFNVGYGSSSGATITMTDMASYNSTKNVPLLSGGQTGDVTFDPITFNQNTAKNLKVYITWTSDQNHSNDTVNQNTVFLPGVHKKILYEAHTNTSCGPCASQNPALDAFVQSHFDSIVPIKYHTWWPSSGDPMYAINTSQQRVRTQYNQISAVPTLTVDGVHTQVSGYTTLSNLLNPFNTRRAIASPIAISVTDTRLPGDTIKATISINVVSAVPSNVNYKLRINAIERKITYSSPPGSNGETVFYDVFRRMYPSTDGMSINTTPGIYTIEYKYKRESAWIDSMIYTAVFIQDDNSHEVINCAKARNYYLDNIKMPSTVINDPDARTFSYNPEYRFTTVTGGIQVENMEPCVPPAGWSIINNDSDYTFWQYKYTAVNGPSLGGSKAVRINYYSYSNNLGTIDILQSKAYQNVSTADTIKFDWAYARRPGFDNDKLIVKVSTDGGTTFPYIIFNKQGSTLATAGDYSSSFVPNSSQWGTFAIAISGLTNINPVVPGIPVTYELSQNYPNPFNPKTKINFSVPAKDYVKLVVYDILGKEVATPVNGEINAGFYSIDFNANNLTSGIYFYKLETKYFSQTKRMILLK